MQSQSCELWFTEKSCMLHLALQNSQLVAVPEAWQLHCMLHCMLHFAVWLKKQICTLKTKNFSVLMYVFFVLHLHQDSNWWIKAKKLFCSAVNEKVVLVHTKYFTVAGNICFFWLLNHICIPYRHNKLILKHVKVFFIWVSVPVFWGFLWKSTWEIGQYLFWSSEIRPVKNSCSCGCRK